MRKGRWEVDGGLERGHTRRRGLPLIRGHDGAARQPLHLGLYAQYMPVEHLDRLARIPVGIEAWRDELTVIGLSLLQRRCCRGGASSGATSTSTTTRSDPISLTFEGRPIELELKNEIATTAAR